LLLYSSNLLLGFPTGRSFISSTPRHHESTRGTRFSHPHLQLVGGSYSSRPLDSPHRSNWPRRPPILVEVIGPQLEMKSSCSTSLPPEHVFILPVSVWCGRPSPCSSAIVVPCQSTPPPHGHAWPLCFCLIGRVFGKKLKTINMTCGSHCQREKAIILAGIVAFSVCQTHTRFKIDRDR
jgi:hypothetical protein